MMRFLFIVITAVGLLSCNGGASKDKTAKNMTHTTAKSGIVEVLYFHGKQRCITCNSIEQLTKQVVDSIASEQVVLRVVDISLPENEALADKYEVAFASLILEKEGTVVNLTEMGFANAKNHRDEFKAELTKAIDKLNQ